MRRSRNSCPEWAKTPRSLNAEQKDKIKITVEGVDKDGKPTHGVWVGKFDGKAYPVKGNLPYNSVAYKVVNDRTDDITAMKDGKIGWTGSITVAADRNANRRADYRAKGLS